MLHQCKHLLQLQQLPIVKKPTNVHVTPLYRNGTIVMNFEHFVVQKIIARLKYRRVIYNL